MKRILCILLILSLLICGNATSIIADMSYIYGDVDADGTVSAADALITLQVVVGKLYLDRD